MTTFTRPDNHTPAAFVRTLRGHVCLRLADTVTPATRWYAIADVDTRLTDMVYTVEPDPRTMDNVIALTEILNSRDPERQKSRDLYTYQLYCDIADTVAA